MTPEQALAFIDSILAQVTMTRADQVRTIEAVKILRGAIDVPVPTAKKSVTKGAFGGKEKKWKGDDT